MTECMFHDCEKCVCGSGHNSSPNTIQHSTALKTALASTRVQVRRGYCHCSRFQFCSLSHKCCRQEDKCASQICFSVKSPDWQEFVQTASTTSSMSKLINTPTGEKNAQKRNLKNWFGSIRHQLTCGLHI